MPTKVSEIVIHFKPAPYSLFRCEGGTCPVPNRLVIRIQPNEGIVLRLGMKKPGEGFEVLPMDMDFSYAELGRLPTEDAYALSLIHISACDVFGRVEPMSYGKLLDGFKIALCIV